MQSQHAKSTVSRAVSSRYNPFRARRRLEGTPPNVQTILGFSPCKRSAVWTPQCPGIRWKPQSMDALVIGHARNQSRNDAQPPPVLQKQVQKYPGTKHGNAAVTIRLQKQAIPTHYDRSVGRNRTREKLVVPHISAAIAESLVHILLAPTVI